VFNKVFKPSDNILFYRQVDKEVYLVIVPIKYSDLVGDSEDSMDGDFQKHAISFLDEGSVNMDTLRQKLEKMKKFEKKDALQVRTDIEESIKEIEKKATLEDKAAQTILSLFKKNDPKESIMWNIFLEGHGCASIKHGRMPAVLALKGSGVSIAGLPSSQFIKLIDSLRNKVKLNVTSWGSCSGGGLNAESLQEIIAISNTISKTPGGGFSTGILLSVATSDESVWLSGSINIKKAFSYFDLMRCGISSISSIMKNASKAIRQLGLDEFANGLIFIPEEGVLDHWNVSLT